SLAGTLFFLPAINARRRRSPVRFLVWLANWAVVFLAMPWRAGVIVWLAAFVFSFGGGGGLRVPRRPQPQAPPQPHAHPAPAQPRAAGKRQTPTRVAAVPASRPAPAVERAARPAFALNKREPTVIRRSGGSSWIRAR